MVTGFYMFAKKKKTLSYWKRVLISMLTVDVVFFTISYSLPIKNTLLLVVLFWVSAIFFSVWLYKGIVISLKRKKAPPKWLMVSLVVMILAIPISACYQNGVFWGKKVLEATFVDETHNLNLVLCQDGHYLIRSKRYALISDTYFGKYTKNADTIEFSGYPSRRSRFIADKIFRECNRIYFHKDDNGTYDKTFYYFLVKYQMPSGGK